MFDKDIKVMTLEAHSSHFAQPLDKNPFSAFKQEFNFQMKWFNRSVGGRAITNENSSLSSILHGIGPWLLQTLRQGSSEPVSGPQI